MEASPIIFRKVVMGSDHGGFRLKEEMKEFLKKSGVEVLDLGVFDEKSVDYPDIAKTVCTPVLAGTAEKGILFCGTGIGISIAANKFEGIRCALCHDHYTSKMSREHNDANIVAIGGRTTGPEVAKDILETFLSTRFQGGRHQARVDKLVLQLNPVKQC